MDNSSLSSNCPRRGRGGVCGSCPRCGGDNGSCPRRGGVYGSCPRRGGACGSCPRRGGGDGGWGGLFFSWFFLCLYKPDFDVNFLPQLAHFNFFFGV